MYTDTQQAIRNTLWNFMGSIMDASGYDNENKKQTVTALMSEELCRFCKNDDEKTIDINTAKPILKAAKWVLESKLMEAKFSNDTNSIKELSLLIASFDPYINKLSFDLYVSYVYNIIDTRKWRIRIWVKV